MHGFSKYHCWHDREVWKDGSPKIQRVCLICGKGIICESIDRLSKMELKRSGCSWTKEIVDSDNEDHINIIVQTELPTLNAYYITNSSTVDISGLNHCLDEPYVL